MVPPSARIFILSSARETECLAALSLSRAASSASMELSKTKV